MKGMTVYRALSAQGMNMDGILAAMQGGRVLELYDIIRGNGQVIPLTLKDEEGRRIYERSLRFVMLLAVRRLYPGQRVRIEYSVGRGVYVALPGTILGDKELDALRREMERITGDDLPFTRKTWSLKEAIRYFTEDGQSDKAELLRLRPLDYFNMYECGGMWEYFYGAMVPSTRYVSVFGLHRLSASSFALQMPDASDPAHPVPLVSRPKLMKVFNESAEWCDILGVKNAADLTKMLESGEMRTFIRVNEALHQKSMAAIADDIAAQKKRVIFIAGPSSSGKTTFCGRLAIQLRVLGLRPVQISLDDYYCDRELTPKDENGEYDFEHLEALQLDRLHRDIRRLLNGEAVELPRFDFKSGKSLNSGRVIRISADQPLLLEGIHGLNPELSRGIPSDDVYKIFVSALACLNLDDHNRIRTTDVRLLRRTVRDRQFRGTPPESTLARWPSVRAGEERWIFPFQEEADVMFNTTLHYELPFLKQLVMADLEAIGSDKPEALPAHRLIKLLNYIPALPVELTDEVPPTSILREFIGGSSFDKG